MKVPAEKPVVLVVDDEYGPRESIAFSLSADFAVEAVDRAKEALRRIAEKSYEAVLLDIRMPEMDGIRALEEIRRIDPHVGVIILTGYGTLQTAQQAMVFGANQYLRKPPDIFELIEAVRKQVAETRQRRTQAAAFVAAQELGKSLKKEIEASQPKIWQGRAAAELVHDLVNPLSVVVGYSSLLASEVGSRQACQSATLGQRAAEYLETIAQAAAYCRYLADNWRRMSRASNSLECLDLVELVRATVRVVFGEDSSIQVSGELKAIVRAARYELMRVLQNLIKNGLEAGAKNVRVEIRVVADDRVELTISDDGSGMTQEQKASALEGGKSTKQFGSGLGIGICRHIVSAHGATFDLDSEPGRGTAVRIVFPAFNPNGVSEG